MKEHPIIFSTPMVQAILAGRKTMTRRIVKPQPVGEGWAEKTKIACENYYPTKANKRTGEEYPGDIVFGFANEREGWVCPYGAIGDRLWVKETFTTPTGGIIYKADNHVPEDFGLRKFVWKPSIFMPRHSSRIALEITNVRVERLQEITEYDARSEGCIHDEMNHTDPVDFSASRRFKILWDEINGKGAWEINPLVWVIEFKKI